MAPLHVGIRLQSVAAGNAERDSYLANPSFVERESPHGENGTPGSGIVCVVETGARRVWMDSWQMECCGDPFAIGSTVRWTVHTPTDPHFEWFSAVLGAEAAHRIDGVEEHHGDYEDEMQCVEGTVRSIEAVFCRFAPTDPPQSDGAWGPVDGSGVRVPLFSASRTEQELDGLSFVGYVVALDAVTAAQLDA
jgi:hypothetical protein